MSTIREMLNAATAHYSAGRLAEAEQGYRRVLALEPRNAFALHQMGALAMDVGRFDVALELLSAAASTDPRQAAYHANLGACYRQLRRPAEAEQSFRKAVELDPKLTQVYTMLGNLLQEQGRLPEAAEAYGRVAQAQPDSADAHFDVGSVWHALGDIDQAAGCYERALARNPDHVPAHTNFGSICKHRQALDEAVNHFRAALQTDPANSAALTNLGSAFELQGRTDEALAAYREAVRIAPHDAVACNNLGAMLLKLGGLDEAAALFERAAAANPRFLPAKFGIAGVHYARGNLQDALAACHQAIEIDPNNAQAYLNKARMLNEQGRRDEAIADCRRAIELAPNTPGAHGNLAIALHLQGHIDEALEHHRREMEINPDSSLYHSNYLYCLNFNPACDPQMQFDEHRAWAAKHADPLTAASPPHTLDRSPDRRLRVGYVSPYFRDHAVNFFSEPILASHDHQAFEVFCYSDVSSEDEVTRRLQGNADHWRGIRGQAHEQVARRIRDDRIDILVDLTGHIGENRLPVFARRPAPIQVTYIGYQNTTGMQAMDYRLTDAYADPPGQTDHLHSERLERLPQTFFCYQPNTDAPPVGPLPARERGYVTFGSFNNFAKVTAEVLATWAEILKRVPESRLVVLADMQALLVRYLCATFAEHGVTEDRLELINRLPRPEYLKLIAGIDVALDPFPFQGHTTTCDCLWQGVPVVTLLGRTYVSRFGSSGLKTLGLDDLIATSRDEYRQIAVDLASDWDRLAKLRADLRPRMATSPLLDFATFTRNLETAYRRMWHDYLESTNSAGGSASA
ncbi:MAG: tetratricopeptide repeat protein [Planctomycetota bacterium]|nr:MAG: tetratricopeptide repeat protein [Planctomycetota bacterium]